MSRSILRPPPLASGSRVSLIAPAGPVSPEGIDRSLQRVRELGWEPLLGEHAAGRYGYLSGTDEQRLADLNTALRSSDNDAIWCLRGGYGIMRIVEGVDWTALLRRPRPLIGFSDNTVLHLVAARLGIVTFHGPHPAAGTLSDFSMRMLRSVLVEGRTDEALPLPAGAPPLERLHGGIAEGPLVGGNLSLLAASLGTAHAVQSEGAILFIEEVGEPAYRIDRLLSQLRLASVFEGVSAIALGAFSECPDEGKPDLPAPLDVVRDRLEGLSVPVLAGLPFGHIADCWTLPIGVRARLDADAGEIRLLEAATTF
jgi:muramoyltetrapeptide carboxypeptidase